MTNLNDLYEPLRHKSYVRMKETRLKNVEAEVKSMARTNMIRGLTLEQSIQKGLPDFLARETGGIPVDTIRIYDHLSIRMHKLYLAWRHFGKAIYDCSALTELFSRTKADDIPVDELDLPFDSFYVHFGADGNLDLSDGRYIEGCYLLKIDQPNEDNAKFLIAFHANYPNANNRVNEPFSVVTVKSNCCAFVALENGTIIGHLDGKSENVDGDPLIAADAPLINRAMAILANFLLYLSTKDAEIVSEYPPSAPAKLVAEAPTKPKARRKLEEMGYSLIRFAGRKFAESRRRNPGESGAGVTAHWRQGHWHRVCTGVGRVNREWRWFHPVRVGDPNDATKPRIYDM